MARLLPLLSLLALLVLFAAVSAAPAPAAAAVRAEDMHDHDHDGVADHDPDDKEAHEEAMAKAEGEKESDEDHDEHDGHDHGDEEDHDEHDGHDHGDEEDKDAKAEDEEAKDEEAKDEEAKDAKEVNEEDTAGESTTTTAPTTTAADDAADDDNNNTCFPGDATVTLASGEAVRMDALQVGDVVHVGAGVYSPVFMFTHKAADASGSYVRLTTASGAALTATRSHFVHANGGLVAAGAVAVGDAMVSASSGAPDAVVRVEAVQALGLFNPQTLHGDVAVGGLVASAYTRAVEPAAAHAALAPARALWNVFGWSAAVFEDGSRLAGALPVQSVVA